MEPDPITVYQIEASHPPRPEINQNMIAQRFSANGAHSTPRRQQL